MITIEETGDEQFPYKIYDIGVCKPQIFTQKALLELYNLIGKKLKSLKVKCPNCGHTDNIEKSELNNSWHCFYCNNYFIELE